LIKNKIWKKDIPVLFSSLLVEYSHTNNLTIATFEEKLKKHNNASNKIINKIYEISNTISNNLKPSTSSENQILNEEILKELALILDNLKEEGQYLMNEEDKTVMIGLDVYLDFLVKQFKEERNNIIHGKYSFFKGKWKTLVYLTALQTLIEKILWYEENV